MFREVTNECTVFPNIESNLTVTTLSNKSAYSCSYNEQRGEGGEMPFTAPPPAGDTLHWNFEGKTQKCADHWGILHQREVRDSNTYLLILQTAHLPQFCLTSPRSSGFAVARISPNSKLLCIHLRLLPRH